MLIVGLAISYLINTYAHKTIVSNALSNNFIYQFLLPIIVLAEGFNNRKKSLNFYKKEILSFGLILPVVQVFVMSCILLGLQYLMVDKMKMFAEYK